MKKVKSIVIICMLFNFLIAVVTLVCGVLFNFSSWVADSLQSLFDFTLLYQNNQEKAFEVFKQLLRYSKDPEQKIKEIIG